MFLLDWTKFSARQQECEGDVLHHVARGNVKHSAGLIQYFKIDILQEYTTTLKLT